MCLVGGLTTDESSPTHISDEIWEAPISTESKKDETQRKYTNHYYAHCSPLFVEVSGLANQKWQFIVDDGSVYQYVRDVFRVATYSSWSEPVQQ